MMHVQENIEFVSHLRKMRHLLALSALFVGDRPATSWVHYNTSCNTQSSAPEYGCDYRPKHVELIGIINKPLLLHLVGVYIIYTRSEYSVVPGVPDAFRREAHH